MRVLQLILGFSIAYLIWAGIVYGICWAFSFTYDWKYPFGVMIIMAILYLRNGGK